MVTHEVDYAVTGCGPQAHNFLDGGYGYFAAGPSQGPQQGSQQALQQPLQQQPLQQQSLQQQQQPLQPHQYRPPPQRAPPVMDASAMPLPEQDWQQHPPRLPMQQGSMQQPPPPQQGMQQSQMQRMQQMQMMPQQPPQERQQQDQMQHLQGQPLQLPLSMRQQPMMQQSMQQQPPLQQRSSSGGMQQAVQPMPLDFPSSPLNDRLPLQQQQGQQQPMFLQGDYPLSPMNERPRQQLQQSPTHMQDVSQMGFAERRQEPLPLPVHIQRQMQQPQLQSPMSASVGMPLQPSEAPLQPQSVEPFDRPLHQHPQQMQPLQQQSLQQSPLHQQQHQLMQRQPQPMMQQGGPAQFPEAYGPSLSGPPFENRWQPQQRLAPMQNGSPTAGYADGFQRPAMVKQRMPLMEDQGFDDLPPRGFEDLQPPGQQMNVRQFAEGFYDFAGQDPRGLRHQQVPRQGHFPEQLSPSVRQQQQQQQQQPQQPPVMMPPPSPVFPGRCHVPVSPMAPGIVTASSSEALGWDASDGFQSGAGGEDDTGEGSASPQDGDGGSLRSSKIRERRRRQRENRQLGKAARRADATRFLSSSSMVSDVSSVGEECERVIGAACDMAQQFEFRTRFATWHGHYGEMAPNESHSNNTQIYGGDYPAAAGPVVPDLSTTSPSCSVPSAAAGGPWPAGSVNFDNEPNLAAKPRLSPSGSAPPPRSQSLTELPISPASRAPQATEESASGSLSAAAAAHLARKQKRAANKKSASVFMSSPGGMATIQENSMVNAPSRVTVKNTFLDVPEEEEHATASIRRSNSAPALLPSDMEASSTL
eukprot:TRINITY_DN8058_c0_g1_i2.p1 TRINITY_DN8058_c0_g1~~TRINITY_DN8058_c0_g1_i2.p1  ORF type:complete len:810 (+),score=181.89 TRINITY_DN8058_c0_g1_i2:140-2569(+)